MTWEVIFYISATGHPVIQNFIDELPETARTRVTIKINLLEEYGTQLRMPYSRSMGGGLLELRVRGRQEIRIFYSFAKRQRVYLLHGYIKKRQTTPRHEIEIALMRKAEIEKL